MSVKDEDIFLEFCDSRGLAESSIRLYSIALQKYCDFTNKTLLELIDEADEEEESGIKMRKRKIKSYLTNFRKNLDERGLSNNYSNHMHSLVRSFYSENEIELPRNFRRKSRRDKKQETIEDIPTMRDVKKILNYANPTYKSIILLMVSSGMSRAEICSLKFEHFYNAVGLSTDSKISIPDLIEKVNATESLIPMWKIERVKTGNRYFTFSSPQSTDAILEYLDQHFRQYKWQPEPEDQLFRNYNKPVNLDTITRQFIRLNDKCGFKKVNNRVLVRPHTLRKLFATTLEKNKMPHLMTRWLLGHSIDNVTNSYFKADPEALKIEYLEVLDQISTDQVEVKIIRTEAYEEIKAEIDMMKSKFLYDNLSGQIKKRR